MKPNDWPFHSQSYWSWDYQQYLDGLAALRSANFDDMVNKVTVYDVAVALLGIIFIGAFIYVIVSSAASLVLKRRVKKMGYWEREGLVDNELAEAVVDKINDLCNRGVMTNREALAKYKQLASAMNIDDLKPRGRGWFLHLKDIIKDRRAKADKTPVKFPDESKIVVSKPEKKEPLSRRSKTLTA